jgi:predicted unusual protein kinase regulating ubiquinone biosynthesis (AarF/ABC1/UbiB family)
MASLNLAVRRCDIFLCAILIYLRLKGTQTTLSLRTRLPFVPSPSESASAAAWKSAHAASAGRLRRLAVRRGALWLKFAQYAASRTDVLPAVVAEELDRCLDAATPLSAAIVAAVVDAQLVACGAQGTAKDIFADFDPATPIACASIAQVHRATLRADGREVVLKVQRPGVKKLLTQDLVDLDRIVRIVAGAEPTFDLRPMLSSWIEMVPLETDFLHEMRAADSVRHALASVADTPFGTTTTVPVSLPDLTTETLYTMEFVPGYSIRDLEALNAAGADRTALIAEVTRAFAIQAFFLGKVNADSHPGNVLVRSPGNTPTLLDFGIVLELQPTERLAFCRTRPIFQRHGRSPQSRRPTRLYVCNQAPLQGICLTRRCKARK